MLGPGSTNARCSSGTNTGVLIGAVIAAVVLTATAILIIAFFLRRKRRVPARENKEEVGLYTLFVSND